MSRESQHETSVADPIANLRVWAWTWFSRVSVPFAEAIVEATPRPSRRRKDARPRDPIARLRLWAYRWLAGDERSRDEEKRRPRVVRGPAPSPLDVFREAAWTTLKRRADLLREASEAPPVVSDVARAHLRGVLEALVFASDAPLTARELARVAKADPKLVKALLAELVLDYKMRGFRLDEIGGGYVFRTSPAFAPFVREQVAKKPVKMSRAQIETLAIVAYRQPVTRPEVDDVRGVDSGAVSRASSSAISCASSARRTSRGGR